MVDDNLNNTVTGRVGGLLNDACELDRIEGDISKTLKKMPYH